MTADTPEVLDALHSAGWAPGSYIVKCINCDPVEVEARRHGDWCMGDKRSWRCRPCAEAILAARAEAATELVAMLCDPVVVNETASREPQRSLTRMDELQVDTSSEAVEALATAVEALPKGAPDDAEILAEWAATLRALAAERDLRLTRRSHQGQHWVTRVDVLHAGTTTDMALQAAWRIPRMKSPFGGGRSCPVAEKFLDHGTGS
jgi:hypothetical protein